MGASNFNIAEVDPATVVFPGAKALKFNLQDVDMDGDADLILHFRTEDLNLNEQSTKASLIGYTASGMPFQGEDTVSIVPQK